MLLFDCLDPSQEILGKYLVEASAGTGKTFAIQHIVTRLIVQCGVPIEKILLVTFTKEATRDLKRRIRSNLEACLAGLHKHLPPFPYLGKDLRSERHRLEKALYDFDKAAVYTIHGFCHKMLREFMFEAPVDCWVYQEIDNAQTLFVLLDYFRVRGKEQLLKIEQWELLLKHHRYDLAHVVQAVANNLGQELQKCPSTDIEETLPKDLDAGKLLEDFLVHSKNFKGICNRQKEPKNSYVKQWEILVEYLTGSREDLITPLLQYKDCLLERFMETNLKKTITKDALNYPSLLEDIRKNLFYPLHFAKNPQKIENTLFASIPSEVVVSADLFLYKMQKAFRSHAFVNAVRGLYEAVLVDEFQDTDKTQWDIFTSYFLNAPLKTLCFVGDPKQSIYSFRKADLNVYLKARAALKTQYLQTNYRSCQSLLDALNTLFSKPISGNWLCYRQQLFYDPVHAGRKEHVNIEDEKKALHFFLIQGSSSQRRWPTICMEEKVLTHIAAEIVHLKDQGFDFTDMAILVKDRFQATRVEAVLSRFCLPSQTVRGICLTKTLAFSWMKNLLQALEQGSFGAVKHFLFHPIMGWEGTDLHDHSAKFQEAFVEFIDIRREYEKAPFFCIMQILDSNLGYLKACVRTRFESFKGEMLHLNNVIETLQAVPPLRMLSALTTLEREAIFEEKRCYSCAQASVSILTMHMSKGLEFPIVFALGVCCRTNLSKEENLDEGEKLRQLYVSFTRARERLYAVLPIDTKQSLPTLGSASPLELFLTFSMDDTCSFQDRYALIANLTPSYIRKWLSKQVNHSVVEVSSNARVVLSSQEPLKPSSCLSPLLLFQGEVFSFSRLAKPESGNRAEETRQLPAGKETGLVLHKLFDQIIQQKLYNPYHLEQISALVRAQLFLTPLEGYEKEVEEMIFHSFHTPLKGFALHEVSHFLSEIFFTYPFHFKQDLLSHAMTGWIDGMFAFKDKVFLLDWKSNCLNGATPLEVMKEKDYFLQAKIYAKAARQYLDRRGKQEAFGGMFYLFLRGLPQETGIVFLNKEKLEQEDIVYDTRITFSQECRRSR